MSNSVKPSGLQLYQVVLYNRAIHPEFFPLKSRQVRKMGGYELESWLMNGSHLLRFEHKGLCASELIADHAHELPQTGIVNAFLCTSEHEFDHTFRRDNVNYMTAVQTETLTDHAYASACQEYLDFARKNKAQLHEWRDRTGKCLSIMDVQVHSDQVHAQAYHLVASTGMFLRSQSIFELVV